MKKIPCDVYTRVVGYYQSTRQFNKGKLAEYNDRKKLKKTPEDKDEILKNN